MSEGQLHTRILQRFIVTVLISGLVGRPFINQCCRIQSRGWLAQCPGTLLKNAWKPWFYRARRQVEYYSSVRPALSTKYIVKPSTNIQHRQQRKSERNEIFLRTPWTLSSRKRKTARCRSRLCRANEWWVARFLEI